MPTRSLAPEYLDAASASRAHGPTVAPLLPRLGPRRECVCEHAVHESRGASTAGRTAALCVFPEVVAREFLDHARRLGRRACGRMTLDLCRLLKSVQRYSCKLLEHRRLGLVPRRRAGPRCGSGLSPRTAASRFQGIPHKRPVFGAGCRWRVSGAVRVPDHPDCDGHGWTGALRSVAQLARRGRHSCP